MNINVIIELSLTLDADHFQKMLSTLYGKSNQLKEVESGYLDLSMASNGITVIFRDSQYKKKVRLLVNSCLVAHDSDDADKLTRKLDKRIAEYFKHKCQMDDFTLSGAILVCDIDVHSRRNVTAYTKALRRIGKVKGFSPASFDRIDNKTSFCLSGNSNDIDFLLYDLESMTLRQFCNSDTKQKEIQSASERTKGILRTEVRLTKPKAIRAYTETASVSGQIAELLKNRQDIFLDTFTQTIPYGDFCKKDKAIEIIRNEVEDITMQRRMLRLVALISEKKSLHLAQKAMNCRNIEEVMAAFAKINLSPVTISKRHNVKYLKCLYAYLLCDE